MSNIQVPIFAFRSNIWERKRKSQLKSGMIYMWISRCVLWLTVLYVMLSLVTQHIRSTRQTGRKITGPTASQTASRVWVIHPPRLRLRSIAVRSFHANHWSRFTCTPSQRYRNHWIDAVRETSSWFVLPNQPFWQIVGLSVCHQRALSTNKQIFTVTLEDGYYFSVIISSHGFYHTF